MSHYKPYSAYKDSGVEWVGGVPSDWGVAPLFAVASERNESNKGMVEDNLLSLSYGSIVKKDINTNDGLLPESFETYQIVRPGDIIFRLTDLQNDKRSLRTAVVSTKGIITSAYVAVSPKSIEPRYFNYLLRAYDVQKVFYSMGGGMRQSMKFEDLRRMPILVPGKDEQEIICEMLDRETVRIDGLVSKKTTFIELLREKRHALITRAVTQGLDPTVKMKDSGVEWLGEVPEHWEMKRLKFIATVQTGIAKGKDNTGKQTIQVPYLRVANVQDGYLDLEDVATIEIPGEDLPRYLLQRGDVLMNEGGDFDKLGRGHVWEGEIDPCIHQNHVFAVRPTKVLSNWLNTFTSSNVAQFYFMGRSKQSTNLASISSSNLMELSVPLPPEAEQVETLKVLNEKITRLDTLINKTVRSLELLKDRRSALITAVVTGQIDVRPNTARRDQLAA